MSLPLNTAQKNKLLWFFRKAYEISMRMLVKHYKYSANPGYGSNICLRHSFLPMPVHYYSPIPDINDLKNRNVWNKRSRLSGINLREPEQLALLQEFGQRFSNECQWPLRADSDPAEFYVDNPSFSYGCAAVTHCAVRYFKPRKVIEIGSGMSSKVIFNALNTNTKQEAGQGKGHYTVVDPYPDKLIRDRIIKADTLIEQRVELIEPKQFETLGENDILFIDSGHCTKIGGDVNYLYLDILPRLNPGVIVHIHDIALPYEYPEVYTTNETFRQFWTEQYLLQSFLCFNSEFEILLGLNYLMTDHLNTFRKAFPFYNPDIHKFNSSSFWIRRII